MQVKLEYHNASPEHTFILLPLDRRRGFTINMVGHARDDIDFVDDTTRNMIEKFIRQLRPAPMTPIEHTGKNTANVWLTLLD